MVVVRPKILFFTLFSLFYSFSPCGYSATPHSFYEASEHTAAGDQIELSFSDQEPSRAAIPLTLPNGLKLTYGELVTLGDFYEILGESISQGATQEEQDQRFRRAFDSFATPHQAVAEVTAILDVSHQEQVAVNEGLARGEPAERIYQRIADENNRQWNCITGGGCAKNTWWLLPGRYIQLLTQDHDHFGKDALTTYQIGHRVALSEAIIAHATHDRTRLELAYALNAYACHFLSDRFAAGHIRTPRRQLPGSVTPAIVGSLLVNAMHDEENQHGLHVHNQRGQHWIAYGDRFYFSEQNKLNRLHLQEMMQASADQIYAAYRNGEAPDDDTMNLIPEPDHVNNMLGDDIAPLFYWDEKNQQLFRRESTTDVDSHFWTLNWWGWTTLLELKAERQLDAREQYALVKAGYQTTALQYGLITDPTVLQLVHHSKLSR